MFGVSRGVPIPSWCCLERSAAYTRSIQHTTSRAPRSSTEPSSVPLASTRARTRRPHRAIDPTSRSQSAESNRSGKPRDRKTVPWSVDRPGPIAPGVRPAGRTRPDPKRPQRELGEPETRREDAPTGLSNRGRCLGRDRESNDALTYLRLVSHSPLPERRTNQRQCSPLS
jgi:hypothetical protein